MNLHNKIYLDNNATTKLDQSVLNSMLPFYTEVYENSGSSHLSGLSVNDHLENATWQISSFIGAKTDEIIYTSGATEAINLAIKGLTDSKRQHLITVSTEHKAILDTVSDHTDQRKYTKTILPVNHDGLIDLELLKEAITEETLLVCIMMVNNETGTIQDIKQISDLVHSKGAFLLCDATQAVGKISIDVKALGIDLMPFSAHKFYGPKGVGALYISKSLKKILRPQITGGGQQGNLRSGTLNVPGIIGFAKACEVAQNHMTEDALSVGFLRDYLEAELLKIDGTCVNGSVNNRIYNTTNIIFEGVFSETLIMALKHISVSSGSACSAITNTPSHVLKGLGLSDEKALSSIRFSLSKYNTKEEIDIAIERIKEIVHHIRKQ